MTEICMEGGCACGEVRYQITAKPMIVHCCHCRECQRLSGTAFALNAMVETTHVHMMVGEPEIIETPAASGNSQQVCRCPYCKGAVWSYYAGAGDKISFIRVGSLDEPDLLPPDIHIYTASKQPWVNLPEGAQIFDEYYDVVEAWPEESLVRLKSLFEQN